MSKQLAFTVKSSIFDRSRLLTIDPEYLEFDGGVRGSGPTPMKFLKKDIAAIRYGVKFIRGYKFYIGRIYCIDVKDVSGKIIKLRLKTIYGIRRKKLGAKYVEMAKTLLRYYFDDISGRYLKLFEENMPIEICGVQLSAEGVFFDNKAGLIPWVLLGSRRYYRYYALYPEDNRNLYKAFFYIEDWNTAVLIAVVESILKMKFPERKVESAESI